MRAKGKRGGGRKNASIGDAAGVDRMSRQQQLLRLIPTPPSPPITTREIASRLANAFGGADAAGEPTRTFIRMIQHDIAKLRAVYAGIQVVEKDGAHRISWSRNAPRVTLRSMGLDEQIAFGVLEKTGIDLLPRTSMKALKPYFDEARGNGARWTRKIAVQPEGMRFEPPRIRPDVEATVYAALLNDVCITIDYRGANGKESKGVLLRPLALIRRNVRTYLVAQGEREESPRTYALHRILKAADTVYDLPKSTGFNLEQYLLAGIAHPVFRDVDVRYGADIALHLRLDAEAAWLQETPLGKDQQFAALPDGGFDLRATVPLTEELVRWILSMAHHVKVLAPAFMARRVRDDARRMCDLYASESRSADP